MTAADPGPRRVFLHVGVPKSGTTFLQRALFRNRKELREAGFLYPGSSHEEMFHAAIEVRGSHDVWGVRPADIEGTWQRLCDQARAFDGTTIISHEILGAASPEQVAAAIGDFDGFEVHVIVTVRDLGRQVTADWQESVKNGSTATFREFRDRLMADIDAGKVTGRFWRAQHVPGVLERWGSAVPVERIHVVPCPPSGADPHELWRRFAEVVGFDPEAYDPIAPHANESLGVAQIALLRRVNQALDKRLVQPVYGRVVKRYFAQRLLTEHGSRRPAYPSDMYDPLRVLAEQWIAHIEATGYPVHGDLNELLPVPPAADVPPPDEVDPREELDTAAAVVADLLVEVAGLRRQLHAARQHRPTMGRRQALRQLLRGGRG